jgi:hypothetical protein
MVKWNAELQFPSDNDYANRITNIVHGESKSSGNLMLTINTEVVSPTIKEIDGKEVDITGAKSQAFYVVTHIYDENDDLDTERTGKARERASKLLLSIGVPEESGIGNLNSEAWDNLEVLIKPLLGKIVLTQMESDIDEQRKTPTQAQLLEAKKKGIHPSQAGSIMKNPITGKQEIKYWPKIVQIYGLSTDQSLAKELPY